MYLGKQLWRTGSQKTIDLTKLKTFYSRKKTSFPYFWQKLILGLGRSFRMSLFIPKNFQSHPKRITEKKRNTKHSTFNYTSHHRVRSLIFDAFVASCAQENSEQDITSEVTYSSPICCGANIIFMQTYRSECLAKMSFPYRFHVRYRFSRRPSYNSDIV